MKNADYWRKRAEMLEEAKNRAAGKYTTTIDQQFNLAQKQLNEQIEGWYGRFAKNNQITLADAKQWLGTADLTEFKWDVNAYIKHGQQVGLDPAFMKQLENASARFHISKLEALKLKTQATIEELYGQVGLKTNSFMTGVYEDSYYHTAYELQKGAGIGWDIAGVNKGQIENVLSKPWTLDRNTFSDRIWKQKTDLLNEVHTRLSQNIILGKTPAEAINAIAAKFNTSKSNAGRLVMTESAYFATEAQKNAFKLLDVEEYEIVATLDLKTSKTCQAMDGEHFNLKDMEPGATAPPFHPWCRTAIAPYFDDDLDEGERAARNEAEEIYYVPQDMKYGEWKQKFVNGGDKTGLTETSKHGFTTWIKNLTAAKPKKEYLTKAKLQENISKATEQLKIMGDQLVNDPTNSKLDTQIALLQLHKADWEQNLEAKLVVEKKKKLLKEQAVAKADLDAVQVKTYTNIWKDPVTTSDWVNKQISIQVKANYFKNQLANAIDPADKVKWQGLLDDLAEFEAEGKNYYKLETRLEKVETELKALTKPGKPGKTSTDAFSQERKDAALWAKDPKEADDVLRGKCGEVWRAASTAEKDAIYDYTSSYSKFNEPLRGIEYGTEKILGVGNVDLDQIGVAYSGYAPGVVKKQINDMTSIIERSSYETDIWVQRGVNYKGMDKFFGIDANDFHLSEKELTKKLIGTEPTDYGFFSAGTAKGKGFANYPIIMNIYAPKGTKMMYAEPFSAYGAGDKRAWDGKNSQNYFGSESEIILQRGTKFRITKVEKANGKIYIDIDVIGQETH